MLNRLWPTDGRADAFLMSSAGKDAAKKAAALADVSNFQLLALPLTALPDISRREEPIGFIDFTIGSEPAWLRRIFCIGSGFREAEAWIPDTLRSLRSLTRSGMTTSTKPFRQSPTLAIGQETLRCRHSRPRERPQGAESVGNPCLGREITKPVQNRLRLAVSQIYESDSRPYGEKMPAGR
jgi:hypothetical protein